MRKRDIDWSYATLMIGDLEVCRIPFPSDPSPHLRYGIERIDHPMLITELQQAIDDGRTIRTEECELYDVELEVLSMPIHKDEPARFQLYFSIKRYLGPRFLLTNERDCVY